jgi:hypothetical protein
MAEDTRPKLSPPSREAPCSVEFTRRQVIEHKLLTALEDGRVVAILASRQDLEDLIHACDERACRYPMLPPAERCQSLAADMRQLMREAFPPNEKGQARRDVEKA